MDRRPTFKHRLEFLALGFVFLLVATGKHRSMLKASDGLKKINWLEADWTPPEIILSSFRKDGKIADMAAEAGFAVEKVWTDTQRLFSVQLLSVA